MKKIGIDIYFFLIIYVDFAAELNLHRLYEECVLRVSKYCEQHVNMVTGNKVMRRCEYLVITIFIIR